MSPRFHIVKFVTQRGTNQTGISDPGLALGAGPWSEGCVSFSLTGFSNVVRILKPT